MGRKTLPDGKYKWRKTYRLYDHQSEFLYNIGEGSEQRGLDRLISYWKHIDPEGLKKLKENTCHDK